MSCSFPRQKGARRTPRGCYNLWLQISRQKWVLDAHMPFETLNQTLTKRLVLKEKKLYSLS